MCLLILKTPGNALKEEEMAQAFRINGDGAGFGWWSPVKKNYFMKKGFFNFDSFLAAYREHVRLEDKAVVHFRIGTHGAKNENNCHPHYIGGMWIMGHNGVISDVKTEGDDSDTVAFYKTELQPFMAMAAVKPENKYKLMDKDVIEKLHNRIGSFNKLVFMNQDGEHIIINEKAGHWNDGNWYSNSSYKKTTYNTSKSSGGSCTSGCASHTKPLNRRSALDTDNELSHLYNEIIEVSLFDGCAFCGKILGIPGDKTFQYNRFSGECYCNECIHTLQGSILVGAAEANKKAKKEAKKDLTTAEAAIIAAEAAYEGGPLSEEQIDLMKDYAQARASEAEDERMAIEAAVEADLAEKKEDLDWREEGRKLLAGIASGGPKQGQLFSDEVVDVKWPEPSKGIVVSGDEELAVAIY